ncbi:hypothetical protein LO749_09495 [Paracoccus denitrificans]|uniref:DUF6950 family protein n=1 Tax=Paracoccus denitrificans TaxID=266 RepID=UPI001E3F340E|nr:hypothetical protein [Paracoccus denitrificans]UFS64402.1 hypothetical protein LO749_09495 [Paracoccus denitrificans]
MAEVERIMSRPFEWGPCDCSSAACDVFAALWGIDPMGPVRGYSGPLAAARMIRRAGGLAALADTLAVQGGLAVGHAAGGIALSAGHRGRQALLICIMPGLWAGKSKDGFAILRNADRGWHLA